MTCPTGIIQGARAFKTRPPCAALRGAVLRSIGDKVQSAKHLNAMRPRERGTAGRNSKTFTKKLSSLLEANGIIDRC